jgi:hypothetical protein
MTPPKSLHTLIDEFFEAEEKATPGDWEESHITVSHPFVMTKSGEYVCETATDRNYGPNDAEFIALSRNTAPEIIRRLSAALACAKEYIEDSVSKCSCGENVESNAEMRDEALARIAEIEQNG